MTIHLAVTDDAHTLDFKVLSWFLSSLSRMATCVMCIGIVVRSVGIVVMTIGVIMLGCLMVLSRLVMLCVMRRGGDVLSIHVVSGHLGLNLLCKCLLFGLTHRLPFLGSVGVKHGTMPLEYATRPHLGAGGGESVSKRHIITD